jgi:hypothetical protein
MTDLFGEDPTELLKRGLIDKFETFWRCYPRRVGKGKAREKFKDAIKKTSLETMLNAITKYVANKPERVDYKHPATWLYQECWDDEWEPQQAKVPAYKLVSRPANSEDYVKPIVLTEEEKQRRSEAVAEAQRRVRAAAASMRVGV